jgi:hypothetical protein
MGELKPVNVDNGDDKNCDAVFALIDANRQYWRLLESYSQVFAPQINIQAVFAQLQNIVRRTPVNEAIPDELIVSVAESGCLLLNLDVL